MSSLNAALTGLSIGLDVASGLSGMNSAKRAAKAQAELEMLTAAENVRRARRRQRQELGQMKLAAAASNTGNVSGYGYSGVIKDAEQEFKREIDWIRTAARLRARGAQEAGEMAAITTGLGTLSGLISGVSGLGKTEGWWGS
jgi:phage terminase large subunit-like protein